MTPKISIIVPCYNQAQYLDECLQSLLDQTFVDWECIIVNDGSSDDSQKIAAQFLQQDSRFYYFHQENRGVCHARNFGISKASAELILPLDGDDFVGLEFLEKAVTCFLQNPNLTLVYSNVMRFGTKNGIWNLKPFSLNNLAVQNMIVVSSVFKKQSWQNVAGFDPKMIYGIEDWEFWIAILKNGGLVKKIDYVGLYYRISPVSRQTNLDSTKLQKMHNYLYKKHIDFFFEHIGNPIEQKNLELQNLRSNEQKLKNKKFIIDLFCKTFFKFTIFKTIQ